MGIAVLTPPQFNRMETTITKHPSRFDHTGTRRQPRRHQRRRPGPLWGIDVGIGIAAGALLKAAAVSMPTLSQFRLAVWSRVMTVGKCTQDPGLRLLLLLISWIGACNVHPRADLEDPPGMSPSGRVTSFRI